MASQFFGLKVKDIRAETEDCVSVAFDVPANLQETFTYNAGQYLTLRSIINGEEVRRSYSICTSPEEEELRVAIKRVEAGRFSTFVHTALKVEDTLDVMPPAGRFVVREHANVAKRYLMIAAGSGITPVISLIQSILFTEPASHVTLLYGNQTRGSVIFKEKLAALKNRYMDRLASYYFFSREKLDMPLAEGRIDEDKLNYFLESVIDPAQLDEAFICGPEAMMLTARAALTDAGLTESQIRIELFGTQIQKQNEESYATERPVEDACNVSVQVDGVRMEFLLHPESVSILDAALERGADLPYACKGGVCTTCKAMLEKGEVAMDVNYGLEPDEVEAGFILTCQAHPRSSAIEVNYDIR